MNCQPDSIFFREEIRNGFLVTEKMKKIWYTEISLLQELDRVCKKYGLRYFAEYGTLLGAVRHKYFLLILYLHLLGKITIHGQKP